MDFSVKDDSGSLVPSFPDLPQGGTPSFTHSLQDLLPLQHLQQLQQLQQQQQQQHLHSPILPLSPRQSTPHLPDSPGSSSSGEGDKAKRHHLKKPGGRKAGSQGYTKHDINEALDLIEAHKPVGREGWEGIAQAYNEYAQRNSRQEREPENLKKKFMSLVNFRKAQNDPECPEDARRAKGINPAIEREMLALGYVDEDTDFEDDSVRKRKGSSDPLEQSNLRRRPEPPICFSPPTPPPPPPLARQLGVFLSQLVQQMQVQQQQQQAQAQQHAQLISVQLMSQQQQHQAFMLNMMKLLLGSKQLCFHAATLPQQLAAIMPAEWNATAAAAAAAAATATAASAAIEGLKVEEWMSSVPPETLLDTIKRGVLDHVKELGVETMRDLLDVIETCSCSDLEEMFGLKPPDINRLKKALAHLAPRLLDDDQSAPYGANSFMPKPSG